MSGVFLNARERNVTVAIGGTTKGAGELLEQSGRGKLRRPPFGFPVVTRKFEEHVLRDARYDEISDGEHTALFECPCLGIKEPVDLLQLKVVERGNVMEHGGIHNRIEGMLGKDIVRDISDPKLQVREDMRSLCVRHRNRINVYADDGELREQTREIITAFSASRTHVGHRPLPRKVCAHKGDLLRHRLVHAAKIFGIRARRAAVLLSVCSRHFPSVGESVGIAKLRRNTGELNEKYKVGP